MTNEGLDQLNKLADEVGNFIQYWGFKRIHGKIWTHMYLSAEPLDAADLQKRLGISKSLASISLSDLLKYNVILKRGRGPRETTVYVCNPEVRSVILNVIKNREALILRNVEQKYFALKTSNELIQQDQINPERIKSLGNMIDEAQRGLNALVDLQAIDFSDFKMG